MKNYKKTAKYILIIFLILMAGLTFFSSTINNIGVTKVEVFNVTSGNLSWDYTVDGFMAGAKAVNIYPEHALRIKEIHIREGESASKGALLITLDTADLRNTADDYRRQEQILILENQLTELNSYETAMQTVADAQENLDKRKTELAEARRIADEPFDDYVYTLAITDAQINLERRKDELEEAEAALLLAKNESGEPFDDYAYQRNIEESAISLERRIAELQEANEILAKAKAESPPDFDNYDYQNEVDTQKNAYERSLDNYYETLRQYDIAKQGYSNLVTIGADKTEITAAKKIMDDAQALVNLALQAVNTIYNEYDKAISDMARAENVYYKGIKETLQISVAQAEKNVMLAKNAADDAQRACDNAVWELDRAKASHNTNEDKAKQNATDNAKKQVEMATRAVFDAQRLYDNALLGYERARTLSANNAIKNIELAEGSIKDAENTLVKAKIALAKVQTNTGVALINLRKEQITDEIERISSIIEGAQYIYAPTDIFVERINVERGVIAQPGVALINAYSLSDGLCAVFTLENEQLKHMLIGTEVSIASKAKAQLNITGIIMEIQRSETGGILARDVIVQGDFGEFDPNEPVSMQFSYNSPQYDFVVPTEAVHGTGMATFVYVVKQRETSLGKESYLQSVKIITDESDGNITAVRNGLMWTDTVVVKSSRPIFAGEQVRVVDFTE